VLRGEAEPESTLVHDAAWYGENDIDLRVGSRIESLADLGPMGGGDAVVIATGARPRTLPGTFGLRTIDDAVALKAAAGSARTATVIGGGFIGCEVAASLRSLGLEVALSVREPALFSVLAAPPLSEALADLHREHGVDVRLGDTAQPAADLVVAGIGVEPNVELARAAGLEVASGVVVDDRFRTSRPGVYAIGDVAEFHDPIFGRRRRIEHWSNAAYHGTQLGRILAGEDTRYETVSSFFSEQFGYVFKLLGDTWGHDRLEVQGSFANGKAVARYLAGDRVVAAAHVGQDEPAEAALLAEIRASAAAHA
jgi:3-phenylpropionate/trans-cinnamate dioxygenase ferredoxin reductase subunit